MAEPDTPLIDTTKSRRGYAEFYERLGKDYPETELVHHRGMGHHPAHRISSRFQAVLNELIPFARRGSFLLDVGCNDGVYTVPYCRMGGRALGVDISPSLVESARKKGKDLPDLRFEELDIEQTAAARGQFDLVLFTEVLEHLTMPDRALTNLRDSLVQGGFLLLTAPTPLFEIMGTINLRYLKTLMSRRLLETHVTRSSENRLAEFGMGGYLYRHDGYYPRGLAGYVEDVGFRCVKSYTIGFIRKPLSPLGRHWLLERSVRKIPILKFWGITNIQLFERI
jgi:2-polyprenyl-3-methyl-5-hydroxy-6-metoxy-1,4-benzoquinol methylase